jgi:hypothetical protein
MKRSYNSVYAKAWKALTEGTPYASGRGNPEKKSGYNSDWPEHGIYRDAVIIHDGRATWAYHGTPIVQRNLTTGELRYSTQGWDTKTTIDRLRYAGATLMRAYGKRWKTMPSTKKEAEVHPEWEWTDDKFCLPQDIWHKCDAWRGYFAPITAVVGASDTGSWEDSPCRPEKELERARSFLSAHGIKTTMCWTETSNIFCIKQWVQVHPKFRDKALLLVKEFLAKEETRYLHLPA